MTAARHASNVLIAVAIRGRDELVHPTKCPACAQYHLTPAGQMECAMEQYDRLSPAEQAAILDPNSTDPA